MANDDTEDDYAGSGRDTIEAICEVMKKYRNQVLTVFCLPRECTSSKDIFYENLGNTSIIELKEDFVSGERAKEFLEALAKDSEINTDQMLFEKLEDEKGYLAPDLHNIFDDWYNNKLKTAVYPQYKDIVTVNCEVIKAAPKGSAYDELNQMIGLDDAKKVINQALNYCKAQKLFADRGMKRDHPTMHMIFTGNPGTAKTTVARLFAKIMKENNLLSKGNLIEVGRGDLVGKYVGWTAPMIQKKLKRHKGACCSLMKRIHLSMTETAPSVTKQSAPLFRRWRITVTMLLLSSRAIRIRWSVFFRRIPGSGLELLIMSLSVITIRNRSVK